MAALPPLGNRGQKLVDVISTYIQVLIGLASGIITAILAFYSDISVVPNLAILFLKYGLIALVASIVFGLVSLGGLIGNIAMGSNDPSKVLSVRIMTILQFVGFAIGIGLIVFSIPDS